MEDKMHQVFMKSDILTDGSMENCFCISFMCSVT